MPAQTGPGGNMRAFFAAAIAAAVLSGAVPGQAEPIGDLFKGKQLRFVLGAAAGQDYDIWARLIGRHLSRYIPGAPTVVVQNMPGAGHMLATNWLYNVAPRDGTVWGMVSRNIPNAAFQGFTGVRYDPTKFNWIGSPELNNRGCFAMDRARVKKAEDLFEHELIVGGTGAGSTVTETPNLLRGLVGMKFKVVDGYAKPQDAVLAMERGELDGLCQTVQSFLQARPEWFRTGRAKALFTLEHEPVAGLAAPTIYKFLKTDEQRGILDFLSSSIELGRPIMLPPEVPADRVDAMRRAFDATIKDAAFRDEAKKMGLDITHRTGEQLEAVVQAAKDTPTAIIAKAAQLSSAN
jgi:tripartite-type tricarboxylate transporter receptor subunit TctC